MEERKIIAVNSVEEIWDGLLPDFSTGTMVTDYHITLQVIGHSIDLDITSSPGGNDEGGYESTSMKATLPAQPGFYFVIYPEDFLNRIGKLFGMEDVVLGYPEFDNKIIVKTDNPERLKSVFSAVEVRQVLQTQSGFSLKLDSNDGNQDHYLALNIQRALNELNELRQMLVVFLKVLGSTTGTAL